MVEYLTNEEMSLFDGQLKQVVINKILKKAKNKIRIMFIIIKYQKLTKNFIKKNFDLVFNMKSKQSILNILYKQKLDVEIIELIIKTNRLDVDSIYKQIEKNKVMKNKEIDKLRNYLKLIYL